ncbi:MAG: DUF2029 domain-containing protein [Actinobacteria bacterium]|nr:DUF2029 domain-containing protein [Actinomycetota bacterium]
MGTSKISGDGLPEGPAGDTHGLRELSIDAPWAGRAVTFGLVATVLLVTGFAIAYHPYDFGVYRWGGQVVTHGTMLYQGRANAQLFTYPPFAALAFTLVATAPAVVDRLVFELFSLLALAAAAHVTLKLAGYRASWQVVGAVVVIGMTLEPVYHTFFLGQINLILLALTLVDMWRAAQGRPAGVLLGIAAAIKLTPLIFLAMLALAGRSRAALTAAVTFVSCGLLAYLVAPGDSKLYWQQHLFTETSRMRAAYISDQSPYAAILRIGGGTAHPGYWLLALSLGFGIAGLVIAAILARQDDWLGATTVTGTTGLLVSPISWTHHWVWVLPALVVLLQGRRNSRIAAACGYVLFVVAPMWFTPWQYGTAQYGFHWLVTLIANCFLVAGVVFVCYMGWRAYSITRGDVAPQLRLSLAGRGTRPFADR